MRYSKQRDLIYDYLKNTKAHPSAEKIYLDLKIIMPNLSLATVYRNLNLLTEHKVIQKLDTGGAEFHYDADMSEHTHFICEQCGEITDIFDKLIDNDVLVNALSEGSYASLCKIFVYGRCMKCNS